MAATLINDVPHYARWTEHPRYGRAVSYEDRATLIYYMKDGLRKRLPPGRKRPITARTTVANYLLADVAIELVFIALDLEGVHGL